MTDDDVRALAKLQIERDGGRDAFARRVGLSPSYVYRQVNGIDRLGDKMLKALGLQVQSVTYGEKA